MSTSHDGCTSRSGRNSECVIGNDNNYMVFAAAAAYNDVFDSGYTCDSQNEEGYSEIGGFARLSGGLMAICDYHRFEQRGRLMRPTAVLREVDRTRSIACSIRGISHEWAKHDE